MQFILVTQKFKDIRKYFDLLRLMYGMKLVMEHHLER